ncbi:hypothetical protein DWU89_00855 [Parabacteroides acidifaciens]|uniref:Uncharacterized protein n=2 Tax=Parabacteroides acidifaciens TaxID=2290935 RepID=A0A3D8HKM4_9BACT|nr:hypothetical protein DWU89_00855 [Parabacteroides acidifaciens]
MSFEPEKYVFYNKPPLPQALFCQIMNLFIPNDYRVSRHNRILFMSRLSTFYVTVGFLLFYSCDMNSGEVHRYKAFRMRHSVRRVIRSSTAQLTREDAAGNPNAY